MSKSKKKKANSGNPNKAKNSQTKNNQTKNNQKSDDDFLTLSLEDGKEIETEILGVFPLEDKEYIALQATKNNDDGDVIIFGYEEDGDDYELVDIESAEEFEEAAREFDRLMN
jgi:hypothetical protein